MLIKDQKVEDFNNNLPCAECRYKSICKYAGKVQPVDVPEIFEVKYVCKEKAKLSPEINVK